MCEIIIADGLIDPFESSLIRRLSGLLYISDKEAGFIRKKILETKGSLMTYVVTEECIKCKFMDCVDVCPVDCFYEGENMLVITS